MVAQDLLAQELTAWRVRSAAAVAIRPRSSPGWPHGGPHRGGRAAQDPAASGWDPVARTARACVLATVRTHEEGAGRGDRRRRAVGKVLGPQLRAITGARVRAATPTAETWEVRYSPPRSP